MNYEELHSKTFDYLRFPISIGVVFIHNNYGGEMVDFYKIDYFCLSGHDIFDLFRSLSKTIPTIATPFFFLVSGYFYFNKISIFNKGVYFSKTQNRIKTLLIPYIAWNVIAFLIPMLTALVKGDIHSYLSTFKDVNPFSLLWDYKYWEPTNHADLLGNKIYKAAPLNLPLWFLRDLFIMSLLSPVIYFFVKKTKLYGITFLGLCFLTRTWTSFSGFSIIAVFFFSLGTYFGLYKKNFIEIIRIYKYPIFIICLLSIIFDTYTHDLPIQFFFIRQVYRITGLFTAIIIVSYLIEQNRIKMNNRQLAKLSFFVYVAHSISILGFTVKIFTNLFPVDSPLLLTIFYLAVSVTTVAVCYAAYAMLKRLTPNFLNFITGKR